MSVVKQVLDIRRYQQYIKPHQQRIKADGGSLVRDDRAKEFFDTLKAIGIYDSCLLAISPDFGIKTRVSGSNTFVSKSYSLKVPTPQYGPELVTNGDFSQGTTGWTPGNASWSITGGKASNDGTNDVYASLVQNGIINSGKFYVVEWDQTITSGSINLWFSGTQSVVVAVAGSGRKSYKVRATVTGPLLFEASIGGVLSIDNISVREVLYSLDGSPTDATQTTSTSQPHLGNIIAPNERPSFKNQNGQANYLTHPTISFAANQAWTISVIVNFYGTTKSVAGCMICGDAVSKYIAIYKTGFISISNGIDLYNFNTKVDFGKNTILHFISNGTSISLYINGVFSDSISVNTQFATNKILNGWSDTAWMFEGSIPLHTIFNRALTPTQVAQLSNYLTVKYPDIPTVRIGNDYWATSNCEMVATPMGNLINNVTINSNTEKITNAADREFSSDTGFWIKGANVTISDGVCHFVNSGITYLNGLGLFGLTTLSKFYKVVFTVKNYVSGKIRVELGATFGTEISSNGTFTSYAVAASNTSFFFVPVTSCTLDIDDVSIQEVGWAGSTELYDGIYAQTAGTVEQKTYAAVKAAAMWCFYNNDASLGAIYGKLYNWYAVKLLQMDIDYYNAANPSTPWGYRVPTDTDFTNLANALGGESVAGGKMKVGGTTYWNSPNTGADNSSGFSALGSGFRNNDGNYGVLNVDAHYRTSDNKFSFLSHVTAILGNNNIGDNRYGFGVRLIKN